MYEGVRDNRCALTTLPEYKLEGLSCRVAGLVPPLQEKRIPRELRRSMEYKAKSNGTASIHPNYNKWVGILDQNIRRNVASSEY